MKICPRCSTGNPDDARFCGECGADLSQVPVTQKPEPTGQTNDGRNGVDNRGQSWGDSTGNGWNGGDGQSWNGNGNGWGGNGNRGWNRIDVQPDPRERVKRPRAPRKKISKKLIFAGVEALVLVALVVAFVVVGNARTSPAKVAETYFLALTEGDWESVCANSDVPDGPFLTAEAFQSAMEELDILNGGEITQISATRRSSDSSSTMGSYLTYVDVEYMLRGESTVRTATFTLVKGEGRQMFFFPEWEVVDSAFFVAEDVQVEVAPGATLVVDGLEVTPSYLTQQTDYSDIYTLDLFVGAHEITTVVDGLGSQTQSWSVSGSNSYCYAADVSASEGVQNTLVAQTKELLEQLFTAALAQSGVTFSNVTETAATDLTGCYESLAEYFYGNDNRYYLSAQLTDFVVWSVSCYYSEGQLCASLDLEFNCAYEYATLSNGYTTGTDTTTDSGYIYLNFVYTDGSWIPSSTGGFSF